MNWGIQVDPEAALGEGDALALETKESHPAASPLLAPLGPPTFFIGLTAAREALPRLYAAQHAARKAIAQHFAEKRGSPVQQIMHRMGIDPRAGVQHLPPKIAGLPSAMPGGAAAPFHPPIPAALPTPAARLMMRRQPMPPIAQSKQPLQFRAAKTPIHPIASAGTVFKTNMRALAGGEGPSEERPKKQLSEEELKAANDEMLKKEPVYKREIVKVMQANLEELQKRKLAEGPGAGSRPVAQVVMDALTRMTESPPGTKEALLTDLRDTTTGKLVLTKCLVLQTKILGVGGLGAVIEARVADEHCRGRLGTHRIAVKVLYEEVKDLNLSNVDPDLLAKSSQSLFEPEVQPLKLIQAAVKPGQDARGLVKQNRWALPTYSATAGNVSEVYIHNNVLFSRMLLLSDIMLGDGTMFTSMQNGSRVSPLSMEARQYVCAALITSVASLHRLDLVHYDIKPENILLSSEGTVYLADFGMCDKASRAKSCRAGLTPLYADPAQAACFLRNGVLLTSPKYDTWSTGSTCYLLLTGDSLPYNIQNNSRVLEKVSSLSRIPMLRTSPGVGGPEKELLAAGVSPLWAQVVSEMLIISRDKRPTLQDIRSDRGERTGIVLPPQPTTSMLCCAAFELLEGPPQGSLDCAGGGSFKEGAAKRGSALVGFAAFARAPFLALRPFVKGCFRGPAKGLPPAD
ncbi:hypothetical protein Esti_006546 [Eimeria stiedai]